MISCLLAAVPAAAQTPATPAPEVLAEVRVHGNHTTPDADVLALAGLSVGGEITDPIIAAATEKLRASGRFADVDVRKRFRSIENPAEILVIIVVDEHAAVSDADLTPGIFKKIRGASMWAPVIDYNDSYGFTFGARVTFVDVLGKRSRMSIPMTWGGDRRIALEVERPFERGPFTRVEGALSIRRRENKFFEVFDTRQEARMRAERSITSWLRVGGGVRYANVHFGEIDERHVAPGIDLLVDTRVDPAYPRNAVHVIANVEQLRFDDGRKVRRANADLRGYLGVYGSTVLAARFFTSQVNQPLPLYEYPLIGGASLLRGYEFGYRAGDNLAVASLEVRHPFNSPLSFGRLGARAFVDVGAVYPYGQKLSDQLLDRGIGAGVFFTAAVFRADLDVAKSRQGDWRVHFGTGVKF